MSMFPHLSSLNKSSPFHLPSLTSRKLSSSSLSCKCVKNPPSSFSNGNLDHHHQHQPLMISHNFADPPSSINLFDFQPPSRSFSSVPFSIRFVQLRKKKSNFPLPKTPPPNLSPLGASVFSLASVISETQKLFFPCPSEDSSCTDTGYSIIWLFEKVFASSPSLTVSILSLMGEFVNSPLKSEVNWAVAGLKLANIVKEREAEMKEEREGEEKEEQEKFECWAEIGIKEERFEAGLELDVAAMSDRKRITYERLIVCNQPNSLILANYAQFLYQVHQDFDRAEEYFKRAMEADPLDAEAMSQYAIFLWQVREDLEKAEEMYVKAMEIEPVNNHYISAYARFLWMTGGTDTCIKD